MVQLRVHDIQSMCNPKKPGTFKGFSVYSEEMRGKVGERKESGRGKEAHIFEYFLCVGCHSRSVTFSPINTFSR